MFLGYKSFHGHKMFNSSFDHIAKSSDEITQYGHAQQFVGIIKSALTSEKEEN